MDLVVKLAESVDEARRIHGLGDRGYNAIMKHILALFLAILLSTRVAGETVAA